MIILAIESSCDETSVAILKDSNIITNLIKSQVFHSKYGGVIPELASRAHLRAIALLVQKALEEAQIKLEDIDCIGVTNEPGLIGALVVGTTFAKGLSIKYNKPIIPINHLEGHIFSGCINNPQIKFPFISLVISGGHTALFFVESYNKYKLIGTTLDDAAGEAFDKIASMLGFPYPGGVHIDRTAKDGNPDRYHFPRSMINSKDYNFSFSGLKTSVKYFLNREFPNGVPEEIKPDICASIQKAIVDVLVSKSLNAVNEYNVHFLTLGGGVSANSFLRKELSNKCQEKNIELILPDFSLCLDNAGMIAFITEKKYSEVNDKSKFSNLMFTARANTLDKRLKSIT